MTQAKPNASTTLAALGALAAGAVVSFRELSDADLPFHLASGKVIVALGHIPDHDVLSFTERPIRYVEAVSDVLLYGLAMRGPTAIQVFMGLVVVGVALLLLLRMKSSGPVRHPMTALALASMGPWLVARPATLAFVLLSLSALLIHRHRENPGSRRGRLALASVVPLHVLFANTHGFVVLALALVVGYALYSLLAHALAGKWGAWVPERDGRDPRFSLAVAVGSVFASALNPAGFRLLTGPGAAIRDYSRISEWRPPTLGLLAEFDPAALLLGVVVVAALLLGRDASGERRVSIFDLGIVLGSVALAVTAVRLVAVGALLAAPIVADRLAPFVRDLGRVRVLCAASTLLLAPVLAIDPGFVLGRGYALSAYPEGAVRFLQQSELHGRMWNHLPFGGWLEWRLYPDYRVMIDGRTGWVHDPTMVERAIASETDPSVLDALADDLDLRFAVTRATEGLPFGHALALSRRWQLTFLDGNSAVYVRADSTIHDSYHLIRHDVSRQALIEVALRRDPPARELMHDARRALTQAPQSSRAAFLLGAAAIASGDAEELGRAKTLLTSDEASVRELDRAWELARRGPE